jgi:hypothetical protein
MQIVKTAPKLIGGIIFISLATTGSAHAYNLIQNGSFENSPSLGSFNNLILTAPSSALPGWDVSNNEIAILNNNFGFGLTTPYGNQFVDLTGGNTGGTGVLKQTIATEVGKLYTLAFDLGISSVFGTALSPPTATVTAGSTTQGFTFNPTLSSSPETKWGSFKLNFVASSSLTDISFAVNNPQTDFVGLDNVSVVVPEPSAVLGLGVLGLTAFSLRKRNRINTSNQETD